MKRIYTHNINKLTKA